MKALTIVAKTENETNLNMTLRRLAVRAKFALRLATSLVLSRANCS